MGQVRHSVAVVLADANQSSFKRSGKHVGVLVRLLKSNRSLVHVVMGFKGWDLVAACVGA